MSTFYRNIKAVIVATIIFLLVLCAASVANNTVVDANIGLLRQIISWIGIVLISIVPSIYVVLASGRNDGLEEELTHNEYPKTVSTLSQTQL